MSSAPKEKIEILQPSKCSLRDIPAINLTALPTKGGISVNVHNSDVTKGGNCQGRIISGNEEFELIDYREYERTANKYTAFDIPVNS